SWPFLLVQRVFAELRFETPRRQSKRFGRSGPIALGSLEGARQPEPFGGPRGALPHLVERFLLVRILRRDRGGGRFGRETQMPVLDHASVGKDHRALEAIPQLPDIAGPGVSPKALSRGFVESQRLALELARELLEEPVEQRVDVFGPLAQRRNHYGKD